MNDEMEHGHSALEEELETGFARMFLREERGQAQAWVNWLDETIEMLPTHIDLYKRSVHKLRDLCGQTGSLPEGYTLTDAIALNDPDPISHGGFSDVYRAMCAGRPVALKVLRVSVDDRANVRKAFCQEVVVWKRLSHLNIVPFLGVSPAYPFSLVSPWMEHGSIRSYIQQHPERDRSSWLLDVAMGLEYMHAMGIVHGDLKGPNILIDSEIRACLTDFGLAGVLHHTVGFTTVTGLRGSIRWMSPELLGINSTPSKPTMQSDIWALGVVWWEILTGQMPYPDLYNDVQVIAQLFQKNLLSLSDDFPPMISSTIRDCWEWDPQGRPSAATIITQYPSLPPNALDLASSRPSLSYPSALHQNKLAVEVSPQAPERNSEVHMGWELPEPPKAYIAEDGKNNEDRSHSLGLDFNEKLFTSMPGIITSVTVDYDNHFDSTSVWHYRRPITSVSGGSAVAFGSSNGYVRVWILEPDSLTCKTFRASQDSAADLALPSARHIVACGNFDDPDTRVWDLQACAMLTHPEGLLLRVQNVALSDHGLYLVKVGYALSGSTVIQLWRTTYPTMLGTVHVPNVDVLKPMALSSDGIVVFSKAGSLHAFSMLHVPTQLICHTPVLSWQIDAIAFCGKFAIRIIHFDGWTNRVRCATVDMNSDVSTDVELVNPGRDSWRDPKISCTTLSKDGNRVAVGFRGGHIQTYHAADGRPVNKLLEHHDRTHRQAITGTAFTADSEFLFATNAVGWCWLWHVLSARPVLALTPEGGVEIHDENALAVFREAIAK